MYWSSKGKEQPMVQRTMQLLAITVLICASASAQSAPTAPTERDMYCSGIVTTEPVPSDFYVISGPESELRVGYELGSMVYLNRGASQGVQVGEQFLVTRPRPAADKIHVEWFKWQATLLRAMGQPYADIGRLRVVAVQPNVAIAQIVSSCALMQRGDLVQPFAERAAPPFKPAAPLDRFAPPSNNTQAMVRFSVLVASPMSIWEAPREQGSAVTSASSVMPAKVTKPFTRPAARLTRCTGTAPRRFRTMQPTFHAKWSGRELSCASAPMLPRF
jgi:hypothetical protein